MNNQKSKNTLIFCTSVNGAKKLVLNDSARKYFIASDDKRVHDLCTSQFDNINCFYINQGDTLYSVSTQVKNTLEVINNWFNLIESKISNFPKKILFWENHAEGGQTTQRIQDCFILIKSYSFLIEYISPQEILIVNDNLNYWEDKLIEVCAKKYGIQVKYLKKYFFVKSCKIFYLKYRPLLKEIYYSVRVFHAWIDNSKKGLNVDKDKAVLIQLCDSSVKHINHTEPLVTAINKVGLQGIVFGWNAANAINILKKRNIIAFELENFISIKDLFYSWIDTIRAWKIARKNIRNLQIILNEDANQKLVSIVLEYSLKSFFLGDVAQRHRLHAASSIFFSKYSITAIRLWTRVLPQSIIVYNSLPNPNKIIFFWQPGWPYNIDEPLRKYMVPADIIFALSIEHKRKLISEGLNENQIIIAGLPWIEKILDFSIKNTKEFSRKKIGFSKNGFKFIFFDPGCVLLGIMSLPEQLSQLCTILEFAKENKNVIILIKPHQGHKEGVLENIILEYNLGNVHYFPRNYPVYHILNSCDLLITKMSTLAIEAMCLSIPTISTIFHPEKNFMFYEDAVDYAFTSLELNFLLNRFIINDEHKQLWRKDLNKRIQEYMNRHGLKFVNTNPNLIIANSLKEIILN